VSPADASHFLERVAALSPTDATVTDLGDGYSELTWTNDAISAGVGATEDGAYVHLSGAATGVSSPQDAAKILALIFDNKVAAVAAFAKDVLVYCELARVGDLGGRLNNMDGPGSGDMPLIDRVDVI
jgi:hypothetical protein